MAQILVYIPQIRKKELLPFILFVTLSSFSYFRPLAWEGGPIPKTIYMFLLLYATAVSLKQLTFKTNYSYSLPVKIMMLAIIGSIFMSMIYRGQTFLESVYAAEYPMLGYIFYFFLIEKEVSSQVIERIVVIVALMFAAVFAISFLVYPVHLFQYNETDEDRGLQRILLTGDGCLYLAYFIGVNKLLAKFTIKWGIVVLICSVVIFLSLTRLYIVTCGLIAFYYFFKKQKFVVWAIALGVVVATIPFVAQLKIVDILYKKTIVETKDITKYVRYQSAEYYLTTFQASAATSILGNGFPYADKTAYGVKMIRIQKLQNFYIEDIGLVGLYVYAGLFAVLAYLLIFIKAIFTKLPYEYQYAKMFMLFLFFNGLTSSATFSESFVIAIVFALYIFDASKKDNSIKFFMVNDPKPIFSDKKSDDLMRN